MTLKHLSALAIAGIIACAATGAQAQCVTKGANATAGTEESAKWFVKETMVQAVSWGLWPAFLANGTVPGYTVKDEKYKCSKDGGGVTCRGSATFCPTKS